MVVLTGRADARSPEAALSVRGLQVGLRSGPAIVEEAELQVSPGEILGLVGESGSGKTTTALALLGFSQPGVVIRTGSLRISGREMPMDESMRPSRGSRIAYVPQNPGRTLNPSQRVIDAIRDVLRAHGQPDDSDRVVLSLLEKVGLDAGMEFARRFPHQLSGGQQQRVCIAMALSCDPSVIVLDEPTTGLDVVTQARILDELVRLRDQQRIAMIYVTHDLAVVQQVADRVAVMYAGRIVEQGPTNAVFRGPRHPYTRGLLASIPDHLSVRRLEPMPGLAVGVGERPAGCAFTPRCRQSTEACAAAVPDLAPVTPAHAVRCLHWSATPALAPDVAAPAEAGAAVAGLPLLEIDDLTAEHRSRAGVVVAAAGISFSLAAGACVALVGESGSGKTTIARAVAGLHDLSGGRMCLAGEVLSPRARRRTAEQRRRIQMVFQNPADALNPSHTVEDAVARPARVLRGLDRRAAIDEVARLLERVRLPRRIAERYPAELSGGERQRVAIARALAAGPDIILCDEVTSALDVSVQAAVLDLLGQLRRELGVGLLFITHDLGVVAAIADDVLVLEQGRICERGPARDVLRAPQHPYTQRLLAAAPSLAAPEAGIRS